MSTLRLSSFQSLAIGIGLPLLFIVLPLEDAPRFPLRLALFLIIGSVLFSEIRHVGRSDWQIILPIFLLISLAGIGLNLFFPTTETFPAVLSAYLKNASWLFLAQLVIGWTLWKEAAPPRPIAVRWILAAWLTAGPK